MIRDQDILHVGLKEMVLYQNIKRLGIIKLATCPELFPCSEVIGWILPQVDPTSKIIFDIKGEAFSSFHLAHIEATYKLPLSQVMLTEEWIKGINIDPLEYAKKIAVS